MMSLASKFKIDFWDFLQNHQASVIEKSSKLRALIYLAFFREAAIA
jgi:hypothetical protein